MSNKPNLFDAVIAFMVRRNIRGHSRLLQLFRQHQPYYLIRARSKHGLVFNLEPEDYLDEVVLRTGYYEEEILTALLQELGDDGVLWDIGANIGVHSTSVKHLRPKTQVVCFEPSPFTFSRLYLNANLNGLDLILVNVGLGASAGYAQLSFTISGNSGLTSFKPWGDVSYKHSMLCYCECAADLVRRGAVPSPTVVKIDVEGFEFEVLSGFKEIFDDQTLRAIVFESPVDFIENPDRYPAHALLRKAGFEIAPLIPTEQNENFVSTNFLAKR